jgi:NADH dehydrogenase [ubiquinone] 1 alpha subcomplex assembly factor 6
MTRSRMGEIVRRHDRERFLTALFAPEDRREALFALYAFNHEVAKTREVVTEPMLGQMRLQWWRETVGGIYAGMPRRHDVAEALAAAVSRHHLTLAHFETILEARERDLEPEPPPTLAALEEYAEGTSAELVLLALEVLGAPEAAMAGRHVGIAYALAGLLRAVPFHARTGRSYLPAEFGDERRAVEAVAAAARRHLSMARKAGATRAALPALLTARIAERSLDRLAAARHDPFAPPLARPDPFTAARLTLAAWRGRW